MNQRQKDRLANFRQSPRSLAYENDEDWKIFLALLDEREEHETQERADRAERAQADKAPSHLPLVACGPSAAAMDVDDDDPDAGDDEDESLEVNDGNATPLPIRTKTNEEQAENEDEDKDKDMKDHTPDPTTVPAVPTVPTTTTLPGTPIFTPSGSPIYFFYGTINILPLFINADIQAAVQKLIEMYIARNRLASGTDSCINQRYDGQATDNADGLVYACRTCIDRKRVGENYEGYRVCIRHGQKVMGGQIVIGFFAYAQRRTKNQQYVWRSE